MSVSDIKRARRVKLFLAQLTNEPPVDSDLLSPRGTAESGSQLGGSGLEISEGGVTLSGGSYSSLPCH